tara:strand:- start:104 stop:1042 length:939 start_codon:yes stop_codon:yes gene_type:complete
MSEDVGLLSDPAPSNGALPETPASDTQVSELGQGFNQPDTLAGSLELDAGQPDAEPVAPIAPEGAPTTDPAALDTEAQAGTLRQQDYSRKTMDLADERRAFEAEKTAFIQQQTTQQQQQLQQMQAQQGPAPPSMSQQLRAGLNDPTLTEADRTGLNVVAQMSEAVEALQWQNQELVQRVEQFEPQLRQATQVTQKQQQQQQAASQLELDTQSNEAVALYGEEIGQNQGLIEFVARNRGSVSPTTGKALSIAELVGMGLGRTAAETTQAQQAAQGQRTAAKGQVRPVGTPAPPAQGGGPQSRADALAQIKGTM